MLFLLYCIALSASLSTLADGMTQKLRGSHHNIFFSSDPLPRSRNASEYYPMRLSNGTGYVCVIPSTDTGVHSVPASSLFDENGIVPSEAVGQLHKDLQNWCFFVSKDWWTYKLCWNKKVEQYHVKKVMQYEGGTVKAVTDYVPIRFLLGKASEDDDGGMDAKQNALEYRFGQDTEGERYVTTVYKHGTLCDRTKVPRETEVRLYCASDSEDGRLLVQEVEVCRYMTRLFTRHACIPALQSVLRRSDIFCHLVTPSAV